MFQPQHKEKKMEMPVIPMDHLTPEEKSIAIGIVSTRGKNKNRLRASKPKIDYTIVKKDNVPYRIPSLETGRIAYVWRMVAFHLSPIASHHCLPMLAEFDLPGTVEEGRAEARKLNVLVDKIVNAVPKTLWQGIGRWARALGHSI
jgi:hypothetical protein